MKKYFKLLLAVSLVSGLAFTSCKKDEKKDDEPKTTANTANYDGSSFTLASSWVQNYGSFGAANNIDLLLLGDGITITSDSTGTGIANVLYLEIFTTGSNFLSTGTYTFNETSSDAGAFNGTFYVNLNAATDDAQDDFLISSGTLQVTAHTANNISVVFSGNLSNGKTLTANYSGSFRYSDRSDEMTSNDVILGKEKLKM